MHGTCEMTGIWKKQLSWITSILFCFCEGSVLDFTSHGSFPDSKAHGANMGPNWGRQDPSGPHVGPMNLAIWVCFSKTWLFMAYISINTERGIVKWGLLYWWFLLGLVNINHNINSTRLSDTYLRQRTMSQLGHGLDNSLDHLCLIFNCNTFQLPLNQYMMYAKWQSILLAWRGPQKFGESANFHN